MVRVANVEDPQAGILISAREHGRIVRTIDRASFAVVDGNSTTSIRGVVDERAAIGGRVHVEHQFRDEKGLRLVGEIDDLRIPIWRRAPRTRGAETASATCSA